MADKHPLQKALEFIEEQEGGFRVREYSGRGMYGSRCLSISGDEINPIQIGFLIAEWNRESEEAESGMVMEYDLDRTRQDSMGLGIVLYWPNIPFVEDEYAPENDDAD